MKRNLFCLTFIFAFTFLVAVTGGYFVNVASPEYNSLQQPSFAPPSIVFIIAWTLIFLFTATAAYLTCINGQKNLLYIFALNGGLNALWTYVFFNQGNITLALYIIFALIFTIIYIIRKSDDGRVKLLMLPYLFWLFIATILNYSIIILN